MNDAPEKSVQLTDPAAFAQDFLKLTISQGFQSLSKKDIELLIFFLLERDGAIPHAASNYEVSALLRLPISRVKALRRDSYPRWRPLLNETRPQAIERICKVLFTMENLRSGATHATGKNREDGFIAVRVEHPADLVEFEQTIIEVGGIPVYERNRDVLLVRFETIVAISEKFNFINKKPSDFRADIKKLIGKEETLEKLLTKPFNELSWEDARLFINQAGSKVFVKSFTPDSVYALFKMVMPFL